MDYTIMKNKLNVLINIFFPIWIVLTIALLLGCLAPLVDRYFSKSHSFDSSSYGLIVPAANLGGSHVAKPGCCNYCYGNHFGKGQATRESLRQALDSLG